MIEHSISVVIVNYKGEKLLPECLDAVLNQSVQPKEIIVVDNNSPDNSVGIIKENYSDIKLIESAENLFFCKGSNLGLESSSADFVLLLNNDCILDPDYLKHTSLLLKQNEGIGAVTGKIWRIDGETLDAAGQIVSRSRKPIDRGYGQPDTGQFDTPGKVFSAGGIAPLIRKKMLNDVAIEGQYFDEGFVQYYEDLDLFWRANLLGWDIWYTPEATARHYRGATGQSEKGSSFVNKFAFANLPEFLQAHVLKNRWAVMAKNDRLLSFLLGLPWILFYEIKVIIYMLLIKPSLLKKYIQGFRFLRTAFKRRKLIIEKMKNRISEQSS